MRKNSNKGENNADTGHTFESYFKRAISPILVLQLLNEKPMYAYQIMQETTLRSNGTYKMPLLYTVLNRLQRQGFVYESGKEISEGNRVRNYYAITDAGKEHLEVLKEEYTLLTSAVNQILFSLKD